jgi:hypothetical protein
VGNVTGYISVSHAEVGSAPVDVKIVDWGCYDRNEVTTTMHTGLAVGIVGVGHGHSNLYIPALLGHGAGSVVAVSDPDPGKLARRAGELGGVAAYRTYAEMFDAVRRRRHRLSLSR